VADLQGPVPAVRSRSCILVMSIPRPGPPNTWSDPSTTEVNRRLCDIGLVVCDSEEILICIRCKHALQPSGQTVSKHLWKKHCVPAKDRVGLNAFVQSLDFPNPNAVTEQVDSDPTNPYLPSQSGFACLQCECRTTSETAQAVVFGANVQTAAQDLERLIVCSRIVCYEVLHLLSNVVVLNDP